MIPFNNRFHGHSSLKFVYKNGDTMRSHLVNIRIIKNSKRKNTRVAVVVSKKILKSAVRRNLIRRRIYEVIHQEINSFNDVYDIVVIVLSSEILALNHKELSKQICNLLKQAGIKKIQPVAKTEKN